jgi:5,10-methylenetetrahydromethanopterin reductase
VRERYAYYEHMLPGSAHAEPVPDALVERFAIAGTPAEARAQLRRLAASGLVDEIALIPHTSLPEQRLEVIRAVGEMLPALAE